MHRVSTSYNSDTQFFLHGFGAIDYHHCIQKIILKLLTVLSLILQETKVTPLVYSLPRLVEAVRCQYYRQPILLSDVCIEFTVSLVWLTQFGTHTLSLISGYLVGITVSLFWLKLQTALTEFMCLATLLHSPTFGCNCFLVAALTELFCQTEFIVSLRFVEAYSRPSQI